MPSPRTCFATAPGVRWSVPRSISAGSGKAKEVSPHGSGAGYGACDVAYLLWDQIAVNVVEEPFEHSVYACKHLRSSWISTS